MDRETYSERLLASLSASCALSDGDLAGDAVFQSY